MFRQKHCEMMSLVACQLIKISVRSGSNLSLLYSEYCVFTVYLGFVFYFFFHTPSYGYTIERVETRSSVCDSFDYVVSRFTMPGEGYFGICLMSDDIGGLCVLEVLYHTGVSGAFWSDSPNRQTVTPYPYDSTGVPDV